MKKVGKLAAVLVVMAAAIGMMGCAQPSGGNNTPAGETIPAGFVKVKGATVSANIGNDGGPFYNAGTSSVTVNSFYYGRNRTYLCQMVRSLYMGNCR